MVHPSKKDFAVRAGWYCVANISESNRSGVCTMALTLEHATISSLSQIVDEALRLTWTL